MNVFENEITTVTTEHNKSKMGES